MKKKQKVGRFFAVLGLLVLGALLVPAVSAGQPVGTVGSDLPALLASEKGLSDIEYIVIGEDSSNIWGYLNTTDCTQPVTDAITGLNNAMKNMTDNKVSVSKVVVTGFYGDSRTSYSLNLDTGMFEKLADPIASVRSSTAYKAPDGSSIILSMRGLINTAGNDDPIGSTVYFWANSVTSPTKTYIVMSTTAEIHKYVNYNWNTIPASTGATLWYVPENNKNATVSLAAGSYRSEGQFSGRKDDGTAYSDPDVIGNYFTIS
ncbi:MAG: hypothetical protein A4E38_01330 [Methanoregulaceae archaeon PtaB.Bin108]|nr:MAG: hypothetical protein A4E38_01330 [Methanoregulaceae archaeon PtaB.Bin108]OPY45559.1 MAG: hypothetical protein A4E42_00752 [Methanoregulaceae archaeon PtaU1.Bin222]